MGVKVTIKVKAKPKAKVTAKPKAKITVKPMDKAKAKVKVAAKKKSLRRLQGTSTPAKKQEDTGLDESKNGLDDKNYKDKNQKNLDVKPADGQEVPFDASANFIKYGLTLLTILFLI